MERNIHGTIVVSVFLFTYSSNSRNISLLDKRVLYIEKWKIQTAD